MRYGRLSPELRRFQLPLLIPRPWTRRSHERRAQPPGGGPGAIRGDTSAKVTSHALPDASQGQSTGAVTLAPTCFARVHLPHHAQVAARILYMC